MKKALLSVLTILGTFLCYAQSDTAFWFAAPDVSTIHELPIHLRMTSYLQPCTVTISQPAGGGMPTQTFSMAPNTTLSVDLSAWITSIECLPGNTIQNRGIKITSSNKISVYYEVNANGPNPELFVLKGRNAVGNDFYISSQYILDNSLLHTPRPKSSFNIVATEDNTSITITPTNNIVGHAANIPFVINLNKGQTYAAIAVSEVAALHLQGSHVISTKPIAITLSDDLLQGGPIYGGFCQDLIGDQTVPVNIIGNEYIAIKSNLNTPFDKIYITATQNATSVMQDGVFVTNLNTGQSTELPVTNNSTYIQSSAPVYAYQLSGVGCEMGSTLLPKVSCTGNSSVSVTRSTSESFYVTLLVRNGGQNSFLVNNVGGVITAAQFAVVPATGGLWYAAKVSLPLANYPNGSVITISNTSNIFQMGVLQGGILSGLAHGYFSDYNSLEANASASASTVCIGSAIQLFAEFIVSANYSWTGPNGFTSNSQNPTIPNAALVNSGMYHLAVNVPGCGTYLDSVMVTVYNCTITCNNWLNTPGQNAYATIGDLDITGNQLTVEALFNRTSPLNSGLYYGHLVSKHSNSSNVNYALLPNGCEITTTNGYKSTFQSCPPALNKTYHVAMVYDGINLKYYRNGFLMSQVACTGNMVNNDFQTTLAQVAAAGFPSDNQFLGYTNEVRIWNVARTQAQLQTYMNSSLPNPTTTPGLLAYYTFDNLLNKQGNAAFNATLNGASTINTTNPNCTFVVDSCVVPVACNNWLSTPTHPSTATIGNLNVTGNQITVEGSFNCTNYSTPNFGGNLVAKHTSASNVCYALSPHGAEISTSNNGYVFTLQNCTFQLNKTYHVAMVYDGASLKFYRNGFLLSQIPCSGNIASNSLSALIGNGPALPLVNQFFGYLNEIRIWNVARTQAQIQTYMNSSLPNPTTQPGLLAYYTFDNLLNKQGNATYNATLNGAASINATNPNCTFVADSCTATPGMSTVINTYTPVLALNPCDNKLTVEDASTFNVGDTVLLIQMKGAVIDSTNTAAFGNVTDYKNAGNYEFNYVKSKAGNLIELKNALTRQYDIPTGKVQLIRVPYYNGSVTMNDTLTCLPWDGSKGGVLVFNVRDTINLNADINVNGKGFRGGVNSNFAGNTLACNQTNYYDNSTSTLTAKKGEGISMVSSTKINGKGKIGNGGGGGNGHNAGGGGGSNASPGGFGGYQLDNCGGAPFDNRGIGGQALTYNNTLNKIFLGGGGGAGHYDGPNGSGYYSNGGNGGGIVLINAGYLVSNNHIISSKGMTGEDCVQRGFPCNHDGMAGGGAGGAVILGINTFVDNNVQNVNGGKGANLEVYSAAAGKVGPGGGGSGGVVWFKSAALPVNSTVQNTGGANGVIVPAANDPWGATPGSTGVNLFNLIVPVDNIPFRPNIDSVRIKDSILSCNGFDFKGLAYTNTNPIASWQWYFGDGGTANTQNTSHAYGAAGTYTVRLIVTDINGCIDSTSKDVDALPGVNAEAGSDTSICSNGTVSVMLNGTAVGGPYLWSPAIYLNNPNIQNPIATINSTTTFYLTVAGSASCTSIDSVTIYINPLPLVDTRSDTAICRFSTLVLNTSSNAATYQWTPAIYVSNPAIASPNYIDAFSHRVYVTGTSAAGCTAIDSVDVTVNPLPVVQTIPDTTICNAQNITLTTTGAQTYSWTPATGLSNPNIASPVFSGTTGQTYTVTGTDINGCKNTDVVTVTISSPAAFRSPPSFTICGQESVQLDGNNGTNVSYLWSPATWLSNPNIIDPWANPPQTTMYTLLVTENTCGFDSTFTVSVTILPAPVVNARKSNDIDCAFRSATLSASGGNQYIWSPSTGLSSTSIPNPVANPATTQQYTVLVTNSAGCTNTDSVTVVVNRTGSLARYMPNAFTPDGNGINDCYGLKNWMYIQQLQFFIFNRYGEQVFATTNPNTCWDGTYKGKHALAGTYVYYIKAQTSCGLEEQKGTFLLIR